MNISAQCVSRQLATSSRNKDAAASRPQHAAVVRTPVFSRRLQQHEKERRCVTLRAKKKGFEDLDDLTSFLTDSVGQVSEHPEFRELQAQMHAEMEAERRLNPEAFHRKMEAEISEDPFVRLLAKERGFEVSEDRTEAATAARRVMEDLQKEELREDFFKQVLLLDPEDTEVGGVVQALQRERGGGLGDWEQILQDQGGMDMEHKLMNKIFLQTKEMEFQELMQEKIAAWGEAVLALDLDLMAEAETLSPLVADLRLNGPAAFRRHMYDKELMREVTVRVRAEQAKLYEEKIVPAEEALEDHEANLNFPKQVMALDPNDIYIGHVVKDLRARGEVAMRDYVSDEPLMRILRAQLSNPKAMDRVDQISKDVVDEDFIQKLMENPEVANMLEDLKKSGVESVGKYLKDEKLSKMVLEEIGQKMKSQEMEAPSAGKPSSSARPNKVKVDSAIHQDPQLEELRQILEEVEYDDPDFGPLKRQFEEEGIEKVMESLVNNEDGFEGFNIASLHHAAQYGDLTMLQYLIDQGEDVNRPGPDEIKGMTALQIAVVQEDVEMAQLLLTAGAKVSATSASTENITPLHFAVMQADIKMITLLVEKGADKSAINDDGVTPVDLSKMIQDPSVSRSVQAALNPK